MQLQFPLANQSALNLMTSGFSGSVAWPQNSFPLSSAVPYPWILCQSSSWKSRGVRSGPRGCLGSSRELVEFSMIVKFRSAKFPFENGAKIGPSQSRPKEVTLQSSKQKCAANFCGFIETHV